MLLPPSRMRCQVRKEIPTTLSRATLQTKDLTKYLWKKYQLTKQEDLLILQMTVMNGNMQKMTKERSRSKVRGHRRAKLKSVAVRCSSSKGPGSGPSRQSCPKSAISITATVIFRRCELEVKNQLRMMMKWLLRSNPYWSKERRKIPTRR